jgi:hypothetical protein
VRFESDVPWAQRTLNVPLVVGKAVAKARTSRIVVAVPAVIGPPESLVVLDESVELRYAQLAKPPLAPVNWTLMSGVPAQRVTSRRGTTQWRRRPPRPRT